MKDSKIRTTLAAVRAAAPGARLEKHREFATFNFAKVYYLGGGWWRVSGYHYAGKDHDDSVCAISQAGSPARTAVAYTYRNERSTAP